MPPPRSFTADGTPLESTADAPYASAARALRWVFFAIGIPVGAVVPRLAEIKAGLGADNASYGTAIAIGGVGAFLGSWLGGRATRAFGSRRVARLSIVAILLSNVANPLVPNVIWLAVIALVGGLTYSLNNIAVNSQAVLIEQGLGRSYIPHVYAFWSLGTMTAAFASSLLAPHMTPLQSMVTCDVVSLALFHWAARGLLRTEHEDSPDDDPRQLPADERIPRGTLRFLALIGLGQALGLLAEMSVGDWSSVLLKQEFHVAVGPNGYGFTAFMLVQLGTRLYASRLIDRFGIGPTIRALGVTGTVGYLALLSIAIASSGSSSLRALVFSCIAYAFLAVAIGAMPSAFTTATGAVPGLPSARALTFVGLVVALLGTVGRIAIANVAQTIPLTVVLLCLGILVLIAVALTVVLLPEQAKPHGITRQE